jgi:hypothetical protein
MTELCEMLELLVEEQQDALMPLSFVEAISP